MTPPTLTQPVGKKDDAALELRQILKDLCAALGGLLDALPGQPTRATDVERVLEIDGPLAWRVFRVATAASSLEAVPYLPTSRQLLRVVGAAEKAGAEIGALEHARDVCQRFHELATSRAKDHAEFESLLGSLAGGAAEQIDLKHRRGLFRGNSHVYGLQARTVYGARIMHFTDNPDVRSEVLLLGYADIHAVRPDVPLTVRTQALTTVPPDPAVRQAVVDVSRQTSGSFPVGPTRLVDGLGSRHRLELEQEPTDDGNPRSRVIFPGIGRNASFSYMLAQDFETVGPSASDSEAVFVQLFVPSEKMVLDLLLPEGWIPDPVAEVKTYLARSNSGDLRQHGEQYVLPLRSTLVQMPEMTNVPSTPDVPGLPQAIKQVLNEKGWYGTKYNLYRAALEYPIMHAKVYLRVRPGSSGGASTPRAAQ